jgi:hypothetical protein
MSCRTLRPHGRLRRSCLAAVRRPCRGPGNGERGLAEIREGLDELRPTGLRLGNSLLFSVFAGACLRASHVDEGLATVDTGLTHCRETTERIFEAELWRLRGELLLRRPHGKAPPQVVIQDAAECFEQARSVARAQGALMLERRASSRDVGAPAVRQRSR